MASDAMLIVTLTMFAGVWGNLAKGRKDSALFSFLQKSTTAKNKVQPGSNALGE